MIVVDLEMSGMNYEKCGIVEIGAIDLETKEEFFEEARLEDEYGIISDPNLKHTVLEVLGKTEEQLRDKKKQSEKKMLEHFFQWCEKVKVKNFVCFHPHADIAFLEHKARKYNLKFPFKSYKVFDLHSVAQTVYLNINKEFLIKEDEGELRSDMGLKNTFKLSGIEDKRGITHNALEDAKMTAEAFYRLIYGKSLLKEYSEFKIPDYLIKK